MTAAPATATISDIIDDGPVGRLQIRVLALTMLIAVIDGFDVNVMGVVAPHVANYMGVAAGDLGLPLAASLFGLMIGGAVGGALGDRFGRRPALIGMFLLGLVATAATALAASIESLAFWRVMTGLGLGGTIPLGAALTAEFMPRRHRTFLVVLMFTGHPIGGALAAFIGPTIIEVAGWHAMFLVGGLLPLAAAVVLWIALPESPRFIFLAGRTDALKQLLSTLRPDVDLSNTVIGLAPTETRTFRLTDIVREGRGPLTALLWAVFFATQFSTFLLASWLPTLLAEAGLAKATATYAVMMFQIGGIVGSVAFGALSDRAPPALVLSAMYGIAVGSIFGLANNLSLGGLLFALAFAAGTGAIGAQLCLNAFATSVYPAHIRATGLGWALSVGRIGAICGPLITGQLLLIGWQPTEIFQALAFVPAFCAASVFFLRARTADSAAAGGSFSTPAIGQSNDPHT